MLTNLKNILVSPYVFPKANPSSNIEPILKVPRSIYPKPGERIGDYTVIDLAGPPGGTAAVFLCSERSGRKVAVKRFFPEKNKPVLRKKIIEEASLGIKSRYLVVSESWFEEQGFIHSVMPYVSGENLANILQGSGPVYEEDALYIATCIAEGAKDLHSRNIISTDIKPGNVIVSKQDGCVKLIDLSSFERPGSFAEVSLGTIPYAAPELIGRKKLSRATDIYSIGVVLFELLVGSDRFYEISRTWEDSLMQGIKPDTSVIRRSHPQSSKIVEKALALDPNKRYLDAKSMLAALDSCHGTKANSSRNCVFVYGKKKLKIPSGRNIIGRGFIDPSNYYISEKQLEIDFSGRLMLRDISMINKAFVNGEHVGNDWLEIHGNDVIQIANVKLNVVLK